jgi:uncharacterized membrane-anchored protein
MNMQKGVPAIVRALTLCGAAFLFSASAHAQPAPAADEATDAAAAFMATLKPQSGTIALPGGKAELKLDDSFRYLSPADTKKLIEDAWGNPPGAADGALGMLIPADTSPLSENGWGVVITYADDGHISDDDAHKIDYDDVLKDMKAASEEHNKEREKAGYSALHLVGWAEPPHYDAAEHKIYWAKDLSSGDGDGQHSLNYYVRVLGREGVLEFIAVSGMNQLQQVRVDMNKVMSFADFTAGNRYTDFNASTDKVAAYGLAALVAGGVAAKTGLLAKLLALLIAGKKVLFLAGAAVVGFFAKFFKRKEG